jgi:hypothetical protein
MHYPRDIETAAEAYEDYRTFSSNYPKAIREIEQYYAISSTGSLVSAQHFLEVAEGLGLPFTEVDPLNFFASSKVDLLIRVPEATIDLAGLTEDVNRKLAANPRVIIKRANPITGISRWKGGGWKVESKSGKTEYYDAVVVATYAMSRLFGSWLDLELPTVKSQVCEVVLGELNGLGGTGMTIMDGPFWSVMPFGNTSQHSLTSVEHTPTLESLDSLTDCQKLHPSCGKIMQSECGGCSRRPSSKNKQTLDLFHSYVRKGLTFDLKSSIWTLKTTFVEKDGGRGTDNRVTQVFRHKQGKAALVFSGKIGSAPRIALEISRWLDQ